jgi:hypothetical protein
VTITVTVFVSKPSEIAPDALPDVTEVPLTVMDAPESDRVGVNVIEAIRLVTEVE